MMIAYKKREIKENPYNAIVVFVINIILFAALGYFVVVSFFGNARTVGHSMNNTLMDGDVVLINQFVYQLRNPKRYDVIVFKPKVETVSEKYIKRIIGLPGETVQIIDGRVYIDGHALEDDVITTRIYNAGLANEPIKLGDDEYFVLGDNRNSSDDSRYANIGNVRMREIIGKAWLVVYPFKDFGGTAANQIEEETEAK